MASGVCRRAPAGWFQAGLLVAAVLTLALAASARAGSGVDLRSGIPTGAQAAAFGGAVRVLAGRFTSIAEVVDSRNHVHVAGTNGTGLWYATDRTGSWVAQRLLTNGDNTAWFETSIALDSGNHVYVAVAHTPCADCTPGASDGIYLLTDRGRPRDTFPTRPTRIAPSGAGAFSLKVANANLYVAYLSDISGHGPLPEVLLRTNVTGRWTTAQVAAHGLDPSLRVGSDGIPRVAYSTPEGIRFAVADSATGHFDSTLVPGTSFESWLDMEPMLSLDVDNHAQIAWSHAEAGQEGIRWAWQTDTRWHGPFTITAHPEEHARGSFGFDVDTFGRPHVALRDREILDVVRTSGGWQSRLVSTSNPLGRIVLRRALAGRVAIAWAPLSGGVWLARN
jgi:hypothetical protein